MAPLKRRQQSSFARWYDKLAQFNVENLFVKKSAPGPTRTIFINQPLPPDYFDDKKGDVKKEHVYPTNQVVTSKYTVLTFLPRNLLEQFRRIANVFFAAIAILQFFPQFSTISPGLVILPLILVLLITGGKDGYEDIKRHQSDRSINLSHVRVLSGGDWTNPNAMAGKSRTLTRTILPMLPRGIKRGKFFKKTGQPPPDISVVEQGVPPEARPNAPPRQSTEPFIEFDHEHDAQIANPRRLSQRRQSSHRHSILTTSHERDITKPHWRRTAWEDVRVGDVVKIFNEESFPADILICSTSEDENVCFVETKNLDGETNLKSRNAVQSLSHLRDAAAFSDDNARFSIELDRPDPHMYKLNGAVVTPNGRAGMDLQSVLLRGTVLKNTKWVIGVILFTGNDTKIILNAGGTPSKRSKVERQMNPQVFVNLLILAVMAVTCAIIDSVLEHRDHPRQAPWLLFEDQSDDNPSINGLITWAFALITFQNIVPISLYISIEAVRTCQAAFIYFDKQIWYEKTNKPTLARSWNLSDDLGQIEYVFSDKTGTLTQNDMVFRHCSVGGKIYRGDDASDKPTTDVPGQSDVAEIDVLSNARSSSTTAVSSSNGKQQRVPEHINASKIDTRSSDTIPFPDPSSPPRDGSPSASTEIPEVHRRFQSADLDADLEEAVHADMGSDNAFQARTLNGFFTVLALCHTVLAANVPDQPGKIEYKAQSPDEAALVQAAADVKFEFLGREKEIVSMRTPFSPNGAVERYELLNVLDFTSARKRMSVILRKLDEEGVDDSDGRIFLLTKGADNVIFERLKDGVNDELKQVTEQHLDHFASEGLRTLTLAYKIVPNDFYEEWITRYDEASSALRDRDERVAEVSDEIEHELRLLGATAIEDRLQDGVPETIADLKLAGIKVWVATGDKLETAIAIGYSTNLIAQESNLIVVRSAENSNNANLSVYHQIYTAIEEFFPEGNIIEEEGLADEKVFSSTEGANNGRDSPFRLQRVNTGVSSIVGRGNGERPGGFVLVIEGTALQHALDDDRSKRLLLRLAILCEAVICCRVSPLQKALIVRLVKDGIGAMTLAIGDGANDVSMIQAADVGVGISGEEGLQAVNSSDYAIAQFRFLKRLLFVHGHWSYARNGNMIVNFFYKNIICIGILWWFMIYCAWSSAYFFEYTYLLFWNVFWSIAPVIAIGLFDRIVDDDILMEIPELYRYGREGHWFGHKTFAIYMIDAVYQSAVIFFVVNYGYFTPTARTDGYGLAQYEYATIAAIIAAMVANAYNGLNTAAWTGWVFFAVLIGPVLIWAYTAIYSLISPGWFVTPIYGNYYYIFRSALFWLSIPICFLIALAPRYIAKAYQFAFMPTDIDRMRWVRKMYPDLRTREELLNAPRRPGEKRSSAPVMAALNASKLTVSDPRRGSRTDMATGMNLIHRGFDFSMEEGGVHIQRMQTNLSERRRSVRMSQTNIPLGDEKAGKSGHKRTHTRHLFHLPRSLRKKKPVTSPSD